jgi:hypothetical protein
MLHAPLVLLALATSIAATDPLAAAYGSYDIAPASVGFCANNGGTGQACEEACCVFDATFTSARVLSFYFTAGSLSRCGANGASYNSSMLVTQVDLYGNNQSAVTTISATPILYGQNFTAIFFLGPSPPMFNITIEGLHGADGTCTLEELSDGPATTGVSTATSATTGASNGNTNSATGVTASSEACVLAPLLVVFSLAALVSFLVCVG